MPEKSTKPKKNGGDIIFTLDTHNENYLDTAEGKFLPVPHCIKGSAGYEVFGKTGERIKLADRVFEKNSFGSLELGEYLRDKGYDEIELCGLVSNICVISNAVIAKAALPEAKIIVSDTDCAFPDMNEATSKILSGMGIIVKF